MYNNREYEKTNIAGAATTSIFTGRGTFGTLTVNSSGTGGTITITDETSPVVTIATITLSGSPLVTLHYDCIVANSLKIVTSASPNITATWVKG